MPPAERNPDQNGICNTWDCAIRNLGSRGVEKVSGALGLLVKDGEAPPQITYSFVEAQWIGVAGIHNVDIGATNVCLNKPACAERILANIAMSMGTPHES